MSFFWAHKGGLIYPPLHLLPPLIMASVSPHRPTKSPTPISTILMCLTSKSTQDSYHSPWITVPTSHHIVTHDGVLKWATSWLLVSYMSSSNSIVWAVLSSSRCTVTWSLALLIQNWHLKFHWVCVLNQNFWSTSTIAYSHFSFSGKTNHCTIDSIAFVICRRTFFSIRRQTRKQC